MSIRLFFYAPGKNMKIMLLGYIFQYQILGNFVHGDLRYKVLDQLYRWKRVQNNLKQAVTGQNNVCAHAG